MAGLSVQMSLVGTIQPEVSLKAQMNAAITAQSDIYDDIAGYIIAPSWEADVVLPTKSKLMKENLTVKKIAQTSVSNEAGGITLILGGQ